jgi:apolipoprotein N-acyltransferase
MTTPSWVANGPNTRMRVVFAVMSGLLLAAAFPPVGVWPAAVLGVALATAAWWRASAKTALFVGYTGGLVFNLLLLTWMQVLGTDAWLILAIGWSIWWLPLALAVAYATWWRWWPVAVPGLWVLDEALRSRMPWGGFPWGTLAFSQADSPWAAWAAVGGTPLVSWLVAFVGCLLVFLVVSWRTNSVRGMAASLGTVMATVVTAWLLPLPVSGQGEVPYAQMALIQGGVPRTGLDFNAQRRAVLNNHVNRTIELSQAVAAGEEPTPVAVIWPENASDVDPFVDQQAAAAISQATDAVGVPVLVGAVVSATDTTLWNVGVVWEPGEGPTQTYVKQHPVPFGEYLPGRQWLQQWITRFDRIPKDFDRGDAPGVLELGPVTVGDVICFEIAYDGLVRDTVRAGARVLVVQTNNATYGGTSQPAQQVEMSRIRAIEHGRQVLVAATSGITAVIDPQGTITAELPELSSGWLNERVALRDDLTLADRVQWAPEAALSVLGLMGAVVGWKHRRTHDLHQSESTMRPLESTS